MSLLEASSPTSRHLLRKREAKHARNSGRARSPLRAERPARSASHTKLITGPLRAARATDAALTFILDRARIDRMARRLVVCGPFEDERLIRLATLVKEVGDSTGLITYAELDGDTDFSKSNLQHDLGELAAFALLWATTGDRTLVRGCKAIAAERQRQRELLAAGRIVEDCSIPATDNRAKFRVLFEECGEVAHAIDQVKHHGLAASNIATELIQVAAVCIAWLEALSHEGTKEAKV